MGRRPGTYQQARFALSSAVAGWSVAGAGTRMISRRHHQAAPNGTAVPVVMAGDPARGVRVVGHVHPLVQAALELGQPAGRPPAPGTHLRAGKRNFRRHGGAVCGGHVSDRAVCVWSGSVNLLSGPGHGGGAWSILVVRHLCASCTPHFLRAAVRVSRGFGPGGASRLPQVSDRTARCRMTAVNHGRHPKPAVAKALRCSTATCLREKSAAGLERPGMGARRLETELPGRRFSSTTLAAPAPFTHIFALNRSAH